MRKIKGTNQWFKIVKDDNSKKYFCLFSNSPFGGFDKYWLDKKTCKWISENYKKLLK